jgi:hypothetical protein
MTVIPSTQLVTVGLHYLSSGLESGGRLKSGLVRKKLW